MHGRQLINLILINLVTWSLGYNYGGQMVIVLIQNHTLDSRRIIFFLLAKQPPVGQGLLTHEVSRSHTTTRHNPLDEWSARRRDLCLTSRNTHKRHPWPGGQTYALDRAAAEIGRRTIIKLYTMGTWTKLYAEFSDGFLMWLSLLMHFMCWTHYTE
jgi:hypothetical protein